MKDVFKTGVNYIIFLREQNQYKMQEKNRGGRRVKVRKIAHKTVYLLYILD